MQQDQQPLKTFNLIDFKKFCSKIIQRQMRLDTSTPTLRISHRHLSKIFIPNSMDRAVQFAGSAMSTRRRCTKPSCRAPAMGAMYKPGTWKAGRRRTQLQDRWNDCNCTIMWSLLCTGKAAFMAGGLCRCHCSSAGLQEGRDHPWATSTPIQPGDLPVRGRGSTRPSSAVLTLCFASG